MDRNYYVLNATPTNKLSTGFAQKAVPRLEVFALQVTLQRRSVYGTHIELAVEDVTCICLLD